MAFSRVHTEADLAGSLRNLRLAISTEAFESALAAWLRGIHGGDPPPESLQGMSIDGKVLRGTLTLDQPALMLISVYDHTTATVLRQQAVPAETNEQKAALSLLKQLVLTGRAAAGDASHCQQETCEQPVIENSREAFSIRDLVLQNF